MDKKTIRQELKDIRFYFSRKKSFDKASMELGNNLVATKIMKYNVAIKNATPRLYDLYYSLYIDNNTIQSLADKYCFSYGYVKNLNTKLISFFTEKFKDVA